MSITQANSTGEAKQISSKKLISSSLLVAGCFQITLGIGSIGAPNTGAFAIEVLVGMVMLLAGCSEMLFAWDFRSFPGAAWRLLRAGCFVCLGIILLAAPLSGIVTLALMLGLMFMLDGAFRLAVASQINGNQIWVILDGALGLLLGFVILMEWPGNSVFILGTLVGIRLIMAGGVMLILGAAIHRTHFEG